jgi:hypothetical protein
MRIIFIFIFSHVQFYFYMYFCRIHVSFSSGASSPEWAQPNAEVGGFPMSTYLVFTFFLHCHFKYVSDIA